MIEKYLKELDLLKYSDIATKLYDFKELGYQEFKSSKYLVEMLRKNDFEVIYPYYLETAFCATYKSNIKGLKIGILCEYDALPEIGHGCGHNLIAAISTSTAIFAKSLVDTYGGELYVIGTPGEENYGGKIALAKEHVFDVLDVCLMLHPDSKNKTGGKTSALIPVSYEFYGKSAHGANPYLGASALDAAVLTYQNINMLRQFINPSSFIHGIIKDGGKAANVIPDYSKLEYYFRADNLKYAEYIKNKADNIAKLIAQANNCTVYIKIYEEIYGDKLINYNLSQLLGKCFLEENIEYEEVTEIPQGSSDIGVVSYIVPTIEGNIKICENTVLCHSKEFALNTINENGKNALKNGIKVLLRLIYKLISDNENIKNIKEEFMKERK